MSNHSAKAFAAGLILVFLITAATSAYAQMPSGMPQEVSGKYVNADAGVEVTFPDGFSGAAIPTPSVTMVTTALGGMSGDSQTMTSITLLITDKQNRDPKDPSSFSNDAQACNTPSIASKTVAGVQAVEVTAECPSISQKMRIVSVATDTKFVVLMYSAPTADFETSLSAFDSAVSSLTVQGAVSADAGVQPGVNIGLELRAMTEPVTISGKSISVDLKTNSTISNFAVDENNKRVTFKAEGETGTRGTTEVSIGKVLKGPYTVTVDGQSTGNFQVIGDEASADAMIRVSYTHSSHDVAITGTNVVPEFSIAMIGIIATMIGVVAVVGRTRLMKGNL